MKLHISTNALAAAAFLSATPLFLAAETYYFDTNTLGSIGYSSNIVFSQSLSIENGGDTVYLWYTKSDDGTKTYLTELPNLSETDSQGNPLHSISFGESMINFSRTFTFDTDINVERIDNFATNFVPRMQSGDYSISVGTISGHSYYTGFYGNTTNLVVGDIDNASGSVTNLGTTSNPLKSLLLTGTWNLTANGGGARSCLYVTGVENHSIDNPDAVINRVYSSNSNASHSPLSYGICYTSLTSAINEDSYTWFNSFEGTAGIVVSGSESSTGTLTAVFTNSATATTSGSLWEGDRDFNRNENGGGKLALVMRSSTQTETGEYIYLNATQTFSGDYMGFSGGVDMISGGLFLNYSATGAERTHGNLKLRKAEGAQSAVFGNCARVVGGTFVFTDLEVSDGGGTIRVRLDINDDGTDIVLDTLTFTGKAVGGGEVTISLTNYEGNDPYDYLAYLITDDVAANGRKIISWSEAAEGGITFTTDLYKTFEYDGIQYIFEAYNGADGLYIGYVQVPEPAEWAAAFGVLALAAAALRRRRR